LYISSPNIGIESPKIRREASRLYRYSFHLMFHTINQKNNSSDMKQFQYFG